MKFQDKLRAASAFGTLLLISGAACAGSYTCLGGATLSADQRNCSDGSIPVFSASEIQPAKPGNHGRRAVQEPGQRDDSVSSHRAAPTAGNLDYFFRGWALFVPGAAYQVPIGLTDYNRIVVSPGTGIAHKLEIRPNGSFLWDGKPGRWKLNAEGDIVLINAYEGKDWSVAANRDDGGIYVMDGSTWFQAKE